MDKELEDALGIGGDGVTYTESDDGTGYYNIQTLQRAVNTIKPLTNKQAKQLTLDGNTALDKAMSLVGRSQMTSAIKPNEILLNRILKDVNDVKGHLKWHNDRIGAQPDKIYENAEDLKKYFIMSFETYNEAIQGVITDKNAHLFREETLAASQFYEKVIKTIAEMASRASKAIDAATNYAKWGLGIAAVAGIGYAWYQLKMAKYKYGHREVEAPKANHEISGE